VTGPDITEGGLEALVRDFLARTLPAPQWTHHAHLLTGLMLARRMDERDLLPTLRGAISAYNIATGGQNTAEAGYHETITAFYAATLAAFARATADLPAHRAAARLLAGPLADRKVVLSAYDEQTLKSSEARLAYRPPDHPDFNPERLVAESLADGAEGGFTIALAQAGDIGPLRQVMHDAIGELLRPFLPPDMVEASREIMGLDTQLIADGTYYVVRHGEEIVGCGGWSRRATLFGGDHSAGRDAALLDPAVEAARIRAMYTKPGWERRGIGRLVLATCEAAAAAEGFKSCELASTMGGEPLYLACGYALIEAFAAPTSSGLEIPLRRMGKSLAP
jgi:GNAT superfamily N-acetyltransferase